MNLGLVLKEANTDERKQNKLNSAHNTSLSWHRGVSSGPENAIIIFKAVIVHHRLSFESQELSCLLR